MFSIQLARAQLEDPADPAAASVFNALFHALEKGGGFDLSSLDSLSYDKFELAVECIRSWRTARYAQSANDE